MTDIYDLIRYEEGWSNRPYHCSTGYPTIGFGFKIGPRGAPLKNYDFTLPVAAGEAWMKALLTEMEQDIFNSAGIRAAYEVCLEADGTKLFEISPRAAVLMSMCYQMGISGVTNFKRTLKMMALKDWDAAAGSMLASLWAQQTPIRAKRHAEQMRKGKWANEYGG